jgi:chromosome segregation ATPase
VSAREFGSQLVRALAGPARQASDDLARLHRRIAELTEERDEALDQRDHHHGMYEQVLELQKRTEAERDKAREALEYAQIQIADHTALGRRLLAERDEARGDAVTNGQAAERLSGELDRLYSSYNGVCLERDTARARVSELLATVAASETGCALEETREELAIARRDLADARAEVVRLGKARDRDEADSMRTLVERDRAEDMADQLAAAIGRLAGVEIGEHSNANDPWRNALQAAESDEVSAATDRLRAALDEERIEPEGANGHGKWCASLHAPPGQTYACDCNEVGAG